MGCGGSKAVEQAKPAEKDTKVTLLEEKPAADVKPEEKPAEPAVKECIAKDTKVTLLDGRSGTVVRATDKDVTVKIVDGAEETMEENKIHKLIVQVIGARGLRKADWIGKSDPYCTVWIDGIDATKQVTKVLEKTLEPTWDETFVLYGYTPESKLCFLLADKDPIKSDDILGKVFLESKKFKKSPFAGELELPEKEAGKKDAFLKVKVTLSPTAEGEPRVKPDTVVTLIDGREGVAVDSDPVDCTVKFGEDKEEDVSIDQIYKINVDIISARGLRDADTFGKSDSYCAVEIEGVPTSKCATKVKDNCLAPEWNEFKELYGYKPGCKLVFTVLDKDPMKTDDILGKFVLEDSDFAQGTFEKEVNLPEKEAKKKDSYLKLKVSMSPTPPKQEAKDPPKEAAIEGEEAKVNPKKGGGVCC